MSRHHKKGNKKKNAAKENLSNQNENQVDQRSIPIIHQQTFTQKQLSVLPTIEATSPNSKEKTSKEESKVQVLRFKRSHVPHHLINYSELIEDERLGLKDEVKKIKKIFLDIYQDAERFSVQLRRANFYPSVFIQFKLSSFQTKQYLFLRDLIRQGKDIFKEHHQKIHCIYNCLFETVPTHFLRLAIFGIIRAKELKIRLSYKMKKEEQGYDLALYYSWDRSRRDVNFTLIDKNLTFVDFSGCNIFKYQDHSDDIDLYEEFLLYLQNSGPSLLQLDENDEEYADIFNQIFEQSSQSLLSKLNGFLAKDLKPFQVQCKQKEQQIINLWSDNNTENDMAFIQKLNDQITYTRMGIQNYLDIVYEVKEQLKNNGNLRSYQYNAFLKRLIMAQKQISSKLPILTKREEIFKLISEQSIVLIEGETGSGKSTQIPQLLCEYFKLLSVPESKPVLVSQPRRLATRTLAERVAAEMGQKLGTFVDYKSSVDKQISGQAKIIFKLDRMVLDQLTEDRLLSSYSCLVIDQAHERTISIDVIAGLIKDLVKVRPDFRVIITSASMDVQLFERYFDGIKALRVSGRLFDVDIRYKPYEGDSMQKIKKVLDEQILSGNNSLLDPFSGHVMIFCHGVSEINELTQHYQGYLNSNRFEVYPLHGKITPEEQRKAFMHTTKHKLIFASRIAETAITIDDVRVVVDPGEDYELVYNQKHKFSSMKLRFISQSSAKQRAGRAGRTSPGFCFRLYSQESFKSRPLGKIPQMENSSLDTVVLRLKSLGIDNVKTFSYISPPDKQGIDTSIESLKIIQALNKNQEITPIGEILLMIPIEPMLGRSLIQAIFIEQVLQSQHFINEHMKQMSSEEVSKIKKHGIRRDIVQILSMVINSTSLFLIPQEGKNQSNLNKFMNFPLKDGDFFLLKSFYEEYKQIYDTLGDRSELKYFFTHFFLNRKALKQVRELEIDINKLFIDYISLQFDFLENELNEVKYKLRFCKTYNDILLLSLVSSFVPNLCRYSGNPEIGYTLISQRKAIQIYGSSSLSLLGLTENSPSWILAYDLYTSEKGRFYCKIAQEIDIDFLENVIGNYAWEKYDMKKLKHINPYYDKISEQSLPTKLYSHIKNEYIHRERSYMESNVIFQYCTLLFDDQNNKITVFVRKDLVSEQNIDAIAQYQTYITKTEAKFKQGVFQHAYLGNTKVAFSNDFTITNLQKIIQNDIIVSQLEPSEYKLINDFLKKLEGVNVFKSSNRIKIQVEDQLIRKSFEGELQNWMDEHIKKRKVQIKRVPRNQRKIAQSKVLIIFKVENILYKLGEKDIGKYYNLLRQIINGEEQVNTFKRPYQWKEDVQGLLVRVNINPEDCAINIWKNQDYSRRKSQYVQIFAQITTLLGGVFRKLIDLQDTSTYLDCKQYYIKEVFEQILSFPTEKVFCALKQEYIAILISLRTKYKGFHVIDKCIRLGNKFRVKIVGKAWGRQALWQASQRIGGLFNPRETYLNERQSYFLQFIDGYAILDKLQHEYKYEIVLSIDSNKLNIYCPQEIYQQIVQKLKSYLQESKYLTKEISFKNKDVSEMIDIINSRRQFLINNTKQTEKIEYQIRFDKKLILLTASAKEHDILQKELDRIANLSKRQCIICNCRVTNSYQLLNCKHSACKFCIAGYLDNTVTRQNSRVPCPDSQCEQVINLFDIQNILSAPKFERLCDERTIEYAQTVLKLPVCLRCQLINQAPLSLDEPCHLCGYLKAVSTQEGVTR